MSIAGGVEGRDGGYHCAWLANRRQIISRPSIAISLSVDEILARDSVTLDCVLEMPSAAELMLRREFSTCSLVAREYSRASQAGFSRWRQSTSIMTRVCTPVRGDN